MTDHHTEIDLLDQDIKDALSRANAPSHLNPVLTEDDLVSFTGAIGSTEVLEEQLVAWTEATAWQLRSVAYGGVSSGCFPIDYLIPDDLPATMQIEWPDGSYGTVTYTDYNCTHDVWDGYEVTHDNSGLTVTQAAVTRDGAGNITNMPALTVA